MSTVLTIQVPKLVSVAYGKYKNRISEVEDLVQLITSVHAVRRIVDDGIVDEVAVQVDAFIPEQHRAEITGPRSRWITPEVYRTIAYIEHNKRTLRAFIESGDAEWDLREQS